MNNPVQRVDARFSLRKRLMMPVMIVLIMLFIINFAMFLRVNNSIDSLNQVYETSVEINDLGTGLEDLHKSFTEFINTRSDTSLEEYKKQYAALNRLIKYYNDKIVSDPILILEKNIRNITLNYLSCIDTAVEKKQLKSNEYKKYFMEAEGIYTHLTSNIRALNVMRFETNSQNYEVLYEYLKNLECFILAILVIMSLVLLMIVYIIVDSITRPLTELAEKAMEVEGGNIDIDIPKAKYQDEVGVLSGAFAQMLAGIRRDIAEIRLHAQRELEMKEKELVTETLLKDAQLKYYQAQISPHFLFNTLNAGQQLAMMEDAERTYSFLENTASFFRGQLRGNGAVSTIDKEIELIDHYMYIMNVRYSGEFLIKKEINESINDVSFPGMVLQPLVENAIHYAFTDWSEDKEKEIKIHTYQTGNHAVIEVADNGVGMSEEKIKDVLTGPVTPAKVSYRSGETANGVGLRNVRERLRLYYNSDKVFNIEKGASGGTRVIITVPISEQSLGVDKHLS
ncbi:sensor histidine kinase [Oribacterium sp. P6A1]|uniref:sensor histidine kinase n=1 Tax=Oribacterium sp. P6A1 TaxID=1410612 RepID=UPI00056770A0|nr:histidine kinase [Oribacterium sp. P6A1]